MEHADGTNPGNGAVFFLRRNRNTILYLGKGNKMVYAWTPFTFFINTDFKSRPAKLGTGIYEGKKKQNQER